ncbi:MAG: DUF4345 domain-containing protein [Saprospiraceae bacterium]|nr:DUF4345 domain-containing protein [Saprospiraceae bacterium]
MQTQHWITRIFLLLLGLATMNIAVQALIDPQTVMTMVDVQLGNVTARNSIRAFYGAVNLAFALFWMYAAFRAQHTGLLLAALYTGGFVLGRVLSIALDGMPGVFALQWLVVEGVCAVSAVGLLVWRSRSLELDYQVG